MTTTTKKAKSKTIQIVWDEFKTIEHHASYLLQEGEAATEKEAFDMACSDSDFIGLEYDDFIAEFSAILKKISAKGRVSTKISKAQHRSCHSSSANKCSHRIEIQRLGHRNELSNE